MFPGEHPAPDSSGQVSRAKTPAWERSAHILLSPLVLVCEPEHAGLAAAS